MGTKSPVAKENPVGEKMGKQHKDLSMPVLSTADKAAFERSISRSKPTPAVPSSQVYEVKF